MTYKFKIVCWIIVLILFRSVVTGDMVPRVPHASGGAFSPVSDHPGIRMDSEQVMIRLEKDSYSVDAEFGFYNTGETVSELVGFPNVDYMTTQSRKDPTDYIRFETWVNGEKAEIIIWDPDASSLRNGIIYPLAPLGNKPWLVHSVKFPANAYTRIRTRYQSRYSARHEQAEAIYAVLTGRYWKDRISKAVFIIDCSGVGGPENVQIDFPMAPGPRLISTGLLLCEIRDMKPSSRSKFVVRILEPKR